MNQNLASLGLACLILGFLFVLAGAGWRRAAGSIVCSAAIAALIAAGVGWVLMRLAEHFPQNYHGGENWGALGVVVGAILGLYVVFFLVFAAAMLAFVLVLRKRILRREKASWILLATGLLFFAAGAAAFALNTPRHASNRRLIQQLEQAWSDAETEDEILRRGAAMVPEIRAELQRLAKPDEKTSPGHDIPPLLRMLGLLGGAEANAELHRWAEGDAELPIRVAAVCALAKQGDRSALPLIAQFLRPGGLRAGYSEHTWLQPELLKTLGEIRAADHVGVIREVLVTRPEFAQALTLEAGIEALAAIGTDEAWAVIAELCADDKPRRRGEVFTALQKVPGPRTVALAARALDDSDPQVREAAYWTIYRAAPELLSGLPHGWSEQTGRKLRAMIQARERDAH